MKTQGLFWEEILRTKIIVLISRGVFYLVQFNMLKSTFLAQASVL